MSNTLFRVLIFYSEVHRQYLTAGTRREWEETLQANITMFKNMVITPDTLSNGFVPLGIDVFPFDSFKRKRRACPGDADGYTPLFACIGIDGDIYFAPPETNTANMFSKSGCFDGLVVLLTSKNDVPVVCSNLH